MKVKSRENSKQSGSKCKHRTIRLHQLTGFSISPDILHRENIKRPRPPFRNKAFLNWFLETGNKWCGACTRCLFFFRIFSKFYVEKISYEPSFHQLKECFHMTTTFCSSPWHLKLEQLKQTKQQSKKMRYTTVNNELWQNKRKTFCLYLLWDRQR